MAILNKLKHLTEARSLKNIYNLKKSREVIKTSSNRIIRWFSAFSREEKNGQQQCTNNKLAHLLVPVDRFKLVTNIARYIHISEATMSVGDLNGVLVSISDELGSSRHDGVVLVTYPEHLKARIPQALEDFVVSAIDLDCGLQKEVALLRCPPIAGQRLILSPTGPITPYDDVRSIYEAAKKGVCRAIKAGVKRPILVLQSIERFPESELSLLLGALEALYVPLEVREGVPAKMKKVTELSIYGESLKKPLLPIVKTAVALELARIVARDIGGGDPERMAPPKVAAYVQEAFAKDAKISVKVIEDVDEIAKLYPLFAAVNRAASVIPRHRGRVVFIEYKPSDPKRVEQTVFLVGKGISYDTGGADIKHGGSMSGMSRDKCGAAAVAGFLKACALLQPSHLSVVGVLCVARNSVGENCYVSDEVIVSRSGKRVRVGNTDAEGRMVMADLLHEMKERAEQCSTPTHLYTVATLTGHAVRAMGEGYSIVLDNVPARATNHAQKLSQSGELLGDMFEISTVRREDLAFHRGKCEGDDILQANNMPSTMTARGHQGPAGFLLLTSGLDNSAVKYSHLDIAGSGGTLPNEPTGAPILALAHLYKLIGQ